jgi:hypothetical protein
MQEWWIKDFLRVKRHGHEDPAKTIAGIVLTGGGAFN